MFGGRRVDGATRQEHEGTRASDSTEVTPATLGDVADGADDHAPEPRPAPAQPATIDAVHCQGLTKVYRGGITAVDGLDLRVRRGEIFGLLGPNGAGKTTTVGMLTTRIVPSGGRALVDGIDVVAEPARAKQVIGVVTQNNTLDRSLTVWQNLYFHCRYFGMRTKAARVAADSALEQVRLTGRAKAEVQTLSGGMARRLMIARAVLHNPAILFLDEPTAGLDPQSRLALWDIIGELHAGGQTILLTTHYMEEADRFCDRLAIVDHGRILVLDTPAGLKQSLGGGVEVTMRAEGDIGRLVRHLGSLPGMSGVREIEGRVHLHLDVAESALLRVVAAAEDGGFKLTELSVAEATLESVFIKLTGKDVRE